MAESSLKEALMNLLFEPETEGEEEKDIERKKPEEKPQHLTAQDLLYDTSKKVNEKGPENRPPRNSGAFIDYGNSKDAPVENDVNNEEYVITPNISPIFGNLDAGKKPKRSNNTSIDYASIEKPSNSHLGMVMSPIYGYDSDKANQMRSTLEPKEESAPEENIEDFDITEDLGDIFGSDEFIQEAQSEEEKTMTEEIDLFSDFYISEE